MSVIGSCTVVIQCTTSVPKNESLLKKNFLLIISCDRTIKLYQRYSCVKRLISQSDAFPKKTRSSRESLLTSLKKDIKKEVENILGMNIAAYNIGCLLIRGSYVAIYDLLSPMLYHANGVKTLVHACHYIEVAELCIHISRMN